MTDKKINKNKLTYKSSGVDIKIGDSFISQIKPLAKKTAVTGANTDLGGFGGIFDLKSRNFIDPILIASTDGVGTKIELAREMKLYKWLGIDLVAMCVNDILSQGGIPLFFLDYYATSKLDIKIAHQILKSISEGCIIANCSLIGGETAEMPDIYENKKFDLAGFCVGAVERDNLLTVGKVKEGDAIYAISSNGFHSNGFSLVRKIIKDCNIDINLPPIFDKNNSLGELLLKPTKIYTRSLLDCFKFKDAITGIAHITGGGLIQNPPRILSEDLCISLDMSTFSLPPIFKWVSKISKIDKYELLQTFNCGIGLIISVNPAHKNIIFERLKIQGENVWEIGEVIKKKKDKIIFKNLNDFIN